MQYEDLDASRFAALVGGADSGLHLSDEDLRLFLLHQGCRPELPVRLFESLGGPLANGGLALRRLADFTGTLRSGADWSLQHSAMCARYRWDPQLGPTAVQFTQFLEDEDCWGPCSDDDLDLALLDVGCRPALVAAVFSILDEHGTSRLGAHEFNRLLALLLPDDAGRLDYVQLGRRYGWRVDSGATLRDLVKMLDDSKGPVSCSTAELQRLLLGLGARPQLILDLFRTLDVDGGRRLSVGKLRRFADLCGFDRDSGEWGRLFAFLCTAHGWDAEAGLAPLQFAHFVSDERSSARCSTEELREILQDLRAPMAARA